MSKTQTEKTTVATNGGLAGKMQSELRKGGPASGLALPVAELRQVKRELVKPDPNQPRRVFSEEKLEELAELIYAAGGILQPLLVEEMRPWTVREPDMVEKEWAAVDETGRIQAFGTETAVRQIIAEAGREAVWYRIVAGERRWRAAAARTLKDGTEWAGLAEVPVIVQDLEERRRFVVQYIENQGKQNLSALEEAEAFRRQIEERKKTEPGFGAEALGRELGVARATVYNRLALTKLAAPVREALVAGKIETSVAGLVAMVPGKGQEKILKEITDEESYNFPYSFRDVEKLVEEKYCKQLREAPFKLEDEELIPTVWRLYLGPSAATEGKPLSEWACVDDIEVTGKRPIIPDIRVCYAAADLAAGGNGRVNWRVWAGNPPAEGRFSEVTLFGPASKSQCADYVKMVESPAAMHLDLVGGGSCAECPRRSGNMPELESRPNICTSPACYQAKCAALTERVVRAAREKGETVLEASESKDLFDRWSSDNRLSYGAPYVKSGGVCDWDPKRRNFQTLLKDAVKPVMALAPNGTLQALLPKREAEDALVEKYDWAKKQRARSEQQELSNGRDDKEQEKRKQLREARMAIAPALLQELTAKLDGLPTDKETEAACWRFMMGWNSEANNGIEWALTRRGLKSGASEKELAKLPLGVVRGLALESLVVDYEGEVVTYEGEWSEVLEDACRLAGLDLKGREKALREPELPGVGEGKQKVKSRKQK